MKEKRILIVGDNHLMCLGLTLDLQKNGYTVCNSHDASDVCQMCFDADFGNQFDCVIVNVETIEPSKVQLMERLRQMGKRVRAVVLSSLDFKKLLPEKDLAGIVMLERPFDTEQLIEAIEGDPISG